MAEDERPPSWVPVDQHVGQVPIVITAGVDGSNVSPKAQQDINALAKQIVRDNQPIINRFVAMQRQQIEIGEKDIHNNVLPLKELTVYYQNVGGLERMRYHIAPKVDAPPEVPEPPPAAPEPPKLQDEEKQQEIPDLRAREPEVPEPDKAPEFEEPKVPEEEKAPETKWEPEEEEKRRGEPEFLQIDIPCFLAVEFGDGAGDP